MILFKTVSYLKRLPFKFLKQNIMDTFISIKIRTGGEFQTTKKFIELFPEGKTIMLRMKKHENDASCYPSGRSFEWPNTILKTSELDFAKGDYKPTILSTRDELMKNWKMITSLQKQHWKTVQKTI